MKTHHLNTLIALVFVTTVLLTGCDTFVDQPEPALDEIEQAVTQSPDAEVLLRLSEQADLQASKMESASRTRVWNGVRSVSAGRVFRLYGRNSYFRPGYRYDFEVDTRSGNPNLYLVSWDSNGKFRRSFDWSRRAPGRDERLSLDPEDLEPEDAYVGVVVHASGDQTARFGLTLWREQEEEEVEDGISLRYPLDRNRQIIGGYEYGDHWLNKYCAESGLTSKRLLHAGVDYYSPEFGETVYAAASGRVRYARSDEEWGGYVVIEHTHADGSSFTTTYTHVKPSVSSGATVTDQSRIGITASGSEPYGPHLDFKIRMRPYAEDELTWILRGRFPEVQCVTTSGLREPAFPEHTIDPETINWIRR